MKPPKLTRLKLCMSKDTRQQLRAPCGNRLPAAAPCSGSPGSWLDDDLGLVIEAIFRGEAALGAFWPSPLETDSPSAPTALVSNCQRSTVLAASRRPPSRDNTPGRVQRQRLALLYLP
jgi:hypothetical protein